MKRIIISVIIVLLFFISVTAFSEEQWDFKSIPWMYEEDWYYIWKIHGIDQEKKYVYLSDYISLWNRTLLDFFFSKQKFIFSKVKITEWNSILNINDNNIKYALFYINSYWEDPVLKYISEISCNENSIIIVNNEYLKFPLGNYKWWEDLIVNKLKNCVDLEFFFDWDKKYQSWLKNMKDYRVLLIKIILGTLFAFILFYIFYKYFRGYHKIKNL